MAYFDDIEKRARELNPEAAEIMNIFDKACAETGATGVCVTTVEGMTDEEEEMAFFAGYLKEGHPPDVAAEKAREAHAKIKEAFRELDAMPKQKGRGKRNGHR